MASGIDRKSPLPFYYQLKQLVLTDLRERNLAPGDRLPGDHELCDTYRVSRTVVRQALTELETEGVIQRVKGRGTFVAPRRTSEHLVQSLTGLLRGRRGPRRAPAQRGAPVRGGAGGRAGRDLARAAGRGGDHRARAAALRRRRAVGTGHHATCRTRWRRACSTTT